jgi:hypothetical protein
MVCYRDASKFDPAPHQSRDLSDDCLCGEGHSGHGLSACGVRADGDGHAPVSLAARRRTDKVRSWVARNGPALCPAPAPPGGATAVGGGHAPASLPARRQHWHGAAARRRDRHGAQLGRPRRGRRSLPAPAPRGGATADGADTPPASPPAPTAAPCAAGAPATGPALCPAPGRPAGTGTLSGLEPTAFPVRHSCRRPPGGR